MANAWEIYQKQNKSANKQAYIPQSTDPWERYRASEAYSKAPKGNHRIDREKQKSTAQQKYEEALKRADDEEKKFSFGTAVKDAGASVLTGAASGVAATGAFVEDLVGGALDTVFQGAGFKGRGLFNTLYKGDTPLAQALGIKGIKNEAEYYRNEAAENAGNIKTGNEKADKVLQKAATGANEIAYGVGNALPMAATAMLSAPAAAANGLATVNSENLIAQGAKVVEDSGVLQTLSQQARAMLKDKDYWTSFAQEVGLDYNEALEDGATEGQAATYAIATALLNSGIEIGSPAEKSGLQNLAKPLWRSAIEEGAEELQQGPVGRLMKNVVYDKNAPIFSTTDEDAVINPTVMAKEFGMGAAVGGILGGSQRLIGNAAKKKAEKTRQAYLRALYAPDTEAAQALVDEALAIDPNNKTALKAAERLKKGKNISGGTVTQLVDQNDRNINQNAAMKKAQKTQEAYLRALEEYDKAQQGTAEERPQGAKNAAPTQQGTEREESAYRGGGHSAQLARLKADKKAGAKLADDSSANQVQTGGTETDGTAVVQRAEGEMKIPESVAAEGPAAVRTYRKLVEAKEKIEAAERQDAENTAQNATESAQERFDANGALQPAETQKTPQTAQEAYMRAVARVDGVQTMTEEQTAQENAAKYGENARTYLAAQKVSTLSAADFENAWSIAYAQGAAAPAESLRENYAALRSAMRAEYTEEQISDTVMEHAFYLGHEEGAKNYEATESNLRKGSQWDDGARADGQAGAVAEGAEKARRKAKDKEAKRLKGRAFRKEDLTEGVKAQATVQIVTEGETESMRRAKAIGAERRLEVHFFRGGNLLVNGSYANGCICDGEVWVRADDPDFTAEQIMRHEAMHDAIEKGEVDPYEIWTKLEQRFGVDRMDGYVEAYGEAVSGIGLSEMEIEEEIICDAAGGMNKFAGKLDLLTAEYGEVLEAAAQEERTRRNTERGPPEGTKNTAKSNRKIKASTVERVTENDYMRLAENPEENIERLQEMVKRAAINAGFDSPILYHGTTKYGFTEIDTRKSDDRISFFTTTSADMAKTYSSTEGVRQIGRKNSRVPTTTKEILDAIRHSNLYKTGNVEYFDNTSDADEFVMKKIDRIMKMAERRMDKKHFAEFWAAADLWMSKQTEQNRDRLEQATLKAEYELRNHPSFMRDLLENATRMFEIYDCLAENQPVFWYGNEAHLTDEAQVEASRLSGSSGNYSFYGRTDNLLQIDANGENWNHIPVDLKALKQYDAKDDGTGQYFTNTRKLAKYAKDHGYSGVKIMNVVDNGGRAINAGEGDIYIYVGEQASKQLKSADPVTYDEDGEIIPLSERFSDSKDIRFSANGTAEVAALEAQNNALKEQIRQLNREKAKLQKQVESKTAQVNKWKNKATFSPERVGKDIIRAYHSTVAETEIHEDIESLIAYAGKAGSSISYGRIKEMAAGVAKKIVHRAETIVNGDVTQEYDAIRAYHRQVKLEVAPALKRDFADWGKWWQENGRKLHIVNSGKSNVDMIYAEMRERFGEGYYPEDLVNPADQLRRMAEVMDSLQPIVENPHSYNMAYAAEACANDLADMVMQEVSRGYAGTITYQLNEQLYRAKQEAREMAQRAIRAESAQRDDARAQIYAERLQRWETEEKRAARRKIAATVRTLDRALRNPTDSNHIPEELRGTVQELCSIFTHNRAEVLQQGEKITVDDHAIFDADKLEKARAYYAELKETEEFGEVYDEETESRLASIKKTIAGKRLSALTLEELREVKAVVEHIRFIARTSDEMFINGRKAKIQSVARGIMIGAGQKGHHEEITLKDGKGLPLKRMIKEGNLKPEYFFRRIDDTALSNLWHDILRGQDTYGKEAAAAKVFFEKTHEKFGVGEWFDGKRKLQMKDAAGNYMTVSMDQAMYMTAAYKRERLNGNTNHVLGGGFVFESDVVKEYKILGVKAFEKRRTETRPHTMNEQTMEKVEKWLAEQDSRILPYVDTMVAYLSDEMAAKGNETSMRLHGYKKFLEKFYIPMQSSREFLEKRFDSGKTNSSTNYKNKGMTKRTTQGANNPIVLRDFHEVWAQHVNEMLLYNAMAVEQDNLQRIMNYKTPVDKVGYMPSESVRAALTDAYGGETVQYIDTLMRDINGGLMTDSREAGVNSMISLFKKNAVFASLSVAIQQPSSIARVMAVMDGKYLVQTVGQKRNYEELKRYSGVAVIKEIGGFDTTTGRSGANWMMEKLADKTAMDKLDKAGTYLPGKMDEITWCHIWNAVKAEIADTTELDPGSEAYFERCGQRFNEVIELTQVYDSVLTRSENMRSQSGLVKVATSFMAEPTVTLNMMAEAVHNVRIKKSGAKKQLHRTMSAVLISILLNNLLKAIVTAPRDKDEDKTILEKYAGKFALGVKNDLNPLTYIPLVSDIWEVCQGYTVEVPYMQTFANAYDGVKSLLDDTDNLRALWAGDWSGVSVDGVADAVNGIAGLFGVPAKNVWRDLRGVATLFKETAPIKDTTFQSVVDAAWESLAKSKTTTERVEDYYYAFRGKSAMKQRNATKDMEKLWERIYNKALAAGCSKKEAESKANSSVKRSVTSFLKPKYQAAKTQAERNAIVTVARHLYLGGHQLYNGYDFAKNWAAED